MTTPSTEVATRAPEPASELARMRDPHTDGWVTVIQSVAKLAAEVANTDFVPRGLKGNPAAVTAAILFGRELGMAPMHALRGIHMVEGRPTLSAEDLRALVIEAGHTIEYEEVSSSICTVRGKRAGSETWTRLSWTIADARQAGLLNKTNWKSYPRQMLTARATAELCRMVFPDATHGVRAREELDDGEAVSTAAAQLESASTTKVGRRKPAAKEIAPITDVELPGPPAATGPVDIAPPPPPAAPVQSKPGPVAATPGEGDGSAQTPSTATGPTERQCPVISNGQQCRYIDQHGGAHSFGGGLKDPIEARHCPQMSWHDAHAWPPAKPLYTCSGAVLQQEEIDEHGQEYIPEPDDLPDHGWSNSDQSGPVDTAPKPMHTAQTKALQARFKGLGFTDEPEDREARLGVASVLAGRTLENPVETFRATGDGCMTYDEATEVMQRLAPCRSRDDVVALMARIVQDLAAEEEQP